MLGASLLNSMACSIDGLGIAKQSRVGLNRKPSVLAVVRVENRF
jgi:hypothetical protein